MRQPPPGATITPTPLALAGRNTVRVGSETLRSMVVSPPPAAGERNVCSGGTFGLVRAGGVAQSAITSSADFTSTRASSAIVISSLVLGPTVAQTIRRVKATANEERCHDP